MTNDAKEKWSTHIAAGILDGSIVILLAIKQIPTGSSYNLEVSKRFIVDYGNGEYERLLFHDPGIMKGRLGYEYV